MRPKQRKFCHYYLQSLNAADAARRAGYNHKQPELYGMRMLQKPPIKAYISERLNAVMGAEVESIKYRIVSLWATMAFGDPISNKPQDIYAFRQHQLKASELLAKYLKLLDTNVNLNLGIRDDQKETIAFLAKHGLADRT